MLRVTLLFALLLPVAAHADTITLLPSQDNSLFSEDTTLSNGAGDYIFAGTTDKGDYRRALIQFDVAGSLPAGATINSATLTLHLSRSKPGDTTLSLHRLTRAWGEGSSHADAEEGKGAPAAGGDATWSHAVYPSTPWSTPGGDHVGAVSASQTVSQKSGYFSWTSATLAQDVQGWLDTPSSNAGWILVGVEGNSRNARRFDSVQNTEASFRPALVVDYTPSSPTGACCASNGGCSVVVHPGSACAGTYSGQNTTCSPNLCPQPPGACCLPVAAATCTSVTEAECAAQGGDFQGGQLACASGLCPVVLEPFVDPLPLPAVAQPVAGNPGGEANYALGIQQVQQKLHRDLPLTTVWGFSDGTGPATYPGPTLEAASGLPLKVIWRNDLRDSNGDFLTAHHLEVDTCLHGAATDAPRAVVHLHGGHVPAEVDGYPEETLLPGEEVVYAYPNNQQAATLWYHDHALGITRLNVIMGLAGFYIVRDAVEAALDLPSGDYDIPIAIQDRTLAPDGSIVYPATFEDHVFGEVAVVNGKVWPYLEVDQGKYRFRLLNGSTSRTWTLSLSTGDTFWVIGNDGGLLEAPVGLTELVLGPGERVEVIMDFESYANNDEITLLNSAPTLYPGQPGQQTDLPEVMKFVVTQTAGHTNPVPSTLRTVDAIPESESVIERDFVLAKGDYTGTCGAENVWLINGLGWDDITEYPRLGTTEVWRFINPSGVMHPMHMHLVFFQVLDRQSFEMVNDEVSLIGSPQPPAAHEAGWKDTVQVAPNEVVRVIARFEDYTGKYAYHCHILEHEDHEMMRQFETTTVCGDGHLGYPAEACDDGNTTPGDGCEPDCTYGPIVSDMDSDTREPKDTSAPDTHVADTSSADTLNPEDTSVTDTASPVDTSAAVDTTETLDTHVPTPSDGGEEDCACALRAGGRGFNGLGVLWLVLGVLAALGGRRRSRSRG